MTVYVFDGTMDGLLTAVFDAFLLKEQPEQLLAEGDALPLFCDHTYHVTTDEEKARRVWAGLEKKLSREALRLISVSWLSELRELNTPLFQYVCKVFRQGDISRNFADADVLAVTNIARRVLHEQLRMKQFIRFQKAKDGTYLGVVSPDHNVLPYMMRSGTMGIIIASPPAPLQRARGVICPSVSASRTRLLCRLIYRMENLMLKC